MSDIPSDPSSQKHTNLPRHRASLDAEADLWTLDDELPSISKPLSPLPEAKVANTEAEAEAEAVIRVDHDPGNQKPYGMRSLKKSRVKEVIAAPEEAPTPAEEPEKIKPFALKSKRATKAVAMTENDVWVDFDLIDEPAAPVTADEKVTLLSLDKSAQTASMRSLDLSHKALPKKTPNIAPATRIAEPVTDLSAPSTTFPDELSAEDGLLDLYDETPASSKRAPMIRKDPASASQQNSRFSRLEIIASFLFLSMLISGGLIGVYLFQSQVQTRESGNDTPHFPIQGAIAQIESAETYWRVPIKEGPNADATQRDVILIPAIDITLNASKSTNGVIRVIFYNETGTIVGDIITREFNNHRFVENGTSSLSFASTFGFTNIGEQENYRANPSKTWTIKVYEGPNENAPSSSFLLLFSIPLSSGQK